MLALGIRRSEPRMERKEQPCLRLDLVNPALLEWVEHFITDMQFNFRHKWLIARLLIVAINIGGIVAIPKERSNLDWGACFLISILCSASLFVWLTMSRSNQDIDWSEPDRKSTRLNSSHVS